MDNVMLLCVDNKHQEEKLSKGTEYKMLKETYDCYAIDLNGDKIFFNKHRFIKL